MIFIFKKKKLVLDCFTERVNVYDYAPIRLANKNLPDWWKQLPKHEEIDDSLFGRPNMKSCYGLIDLYKTGIILPMWSDIRFLLSPDGSLKFQYSDQTSTADFHSPDQRKGWASPDKYTHIKLISPWFFSCKENISWMLIPPMYNQDDLISYLICIGILNFKYQSSTNINIILPIPKERKIIQIDHGQPVAHIIPLADNREIEIKNHLMSAEDYKKMKDRIQPITFFRKYEKMIRLQKSKCPF